MVGAIHSGAKKDADVSQDSPLHLPEWTPELLLASEHGILINWMEWMSKSEWCEQRQSSSLLASEN
jgi:hypothetical protein